MQLMAGSIKHGGRSKGSAAPGTTAWGARAGPAAPEQRHHVLSPGLPPAACQEGQSPGALSPPPAPLHKVTLNLWLAAEVQSRRAIRFIRKTKHQPGADPGTDSCHGIHRGAATADSSTPPSVKGVEEALQQRARVEHSASETLSPATCDPQCWLGAERVGAVLHAAVLLPGTSAGRAQPP